MSKGLKRDARTVVHDFRELLKFFFELIALWRRRKLDLVPPYGGYGGILSPDRNKLGKHVEGLLSKHCSTEEGGRLFKPSKTMRLMLATPSGLEPAFEATEIKSDERICSVDLHEHESRSIKNDTSEPL